MDPYINKIWQSYTERLESFCVVLMRNLDKMLDNAPENCIGVKLMPGAYLVVKRESEIVFTFEGKDVDTHDALGVIVKCHCLNDSPLEYTHIIKR